VNDQEKSVVETLRRVDILRLLDTAELTLDERKALNILYELTKECNG
jgi:hypothetical protein